MRPDGAHLRFQGLMFDVGDLLFGNVRVLLHRQVLDEIFDRDDEQTVPCGEDFQL